ncbi:MAG: hypothetical protein ACK5N8_07975 [Alphaproteobacteria bacterium]
MKKTLILLSGSGIYSSEMVLKNQCIHEEKRSFIVACDNAKNALTLPKHMNGLLIQLVTDFSSVERIIREEKVETLCLYGYTGALPQALSDELDMSGAFYSQNVSAPEESGVYGEIDIELLSYFN